MKNQKGITLVSLVIYVIAMIIVIGVISTIVKNFENNMYSLKADTQDIINFNRFNTYFLKEVKLNGNNVDNIQNAEKDKYILFTSGNTFTFSSNDKKIYFNNIAICNRVEDVSFEFRTYINEEGKDEVNKKVIDVKVTLENFEKSMSYKIEEIY